MICRKDTLGFIDFMRGKYSVYNREYIMNMIKQMTKEEKEKLRTQTFNELWKGIWGNETISMHYKTEECSSREKFNMLTNGIHNNNVFFTLKDLIDESMQYSEWDEAEWGFPKGRRNYQEKDYECALREFAEETGYNTSHLRNIQNILPFEEIFTGSNYKSYKHKYYLTFIDFENTEQMDQFERTEVSKMEWKTCDDCLLAIRPYNLEKKRMILDIDRIIQSVKLLSA